MAQWYILKAFKSRLARRITFWVFGSLLAIEVVILLPSYLKREDDLLAQQEALVMTSLEIAFLNPQTGGPNRLNQTLATTILAHLRSQSVILGGAIYQQGGTRVISHGNYPQVDLHSIQTLLSTPNFNRVAQTYDTTIQLDQTAAPLYLVVRHDAQTIQQALNAYTVRMISMIILISASVTLGTMIGVERLVIRPILYLHADLLSATTNIRQGIQDGQFKAIDLQRRDELGEVITTFQHLYRQIWQAIESREAAHRSEQQERDRADQLRDTLDQLHQTQTQLVQTEKMAGLGKLAAGMAHEINNPITFIHGNIPQLKTYLDSVFSLIQAYQQDLPNPSIQTQALETDIDLEFLRADYPKIIDSFRTGTRRIQTIIEALKNFSRLDETGLKRVDLTQGLNSTLLLLQNRLRATAQRPEIAVIQSHEETPTVRCYPDLINQVLLNILNNAIEAIERQTPPIHTPKIWIEINQSEPDWLDIAIKNNGPPLSELELQKLFDPFYTTKAVGDGTGVSLFSCYQIIHHQHKGQIKCTSQSGEPVTFTIKLPL